MRSVYGAPVTEARTHRRPQKSISVHGYTEPSHESAESFGATNSYSGANCGLISKTKQDALLRPRSHRARKKVPKMAWNFTTGQNKAGSHCGGCIRRGEDRLVRRVFRLGR